MFTRILVPIDFSTESTKALLAAASLARGSGTSVHLLHVVGDPSLEVGATEQLSRLGATIHGVHTTIAVQRGSAAEVITQAVTDIGADLIVMGTRGHSSASQHRIGSVADSVIAHAPCPVMTVRDFGAVRVTAPERLPPDRMVAREAS